MLYRELGKTGEKISILGLGALELVNLDVDSIDEMIKFALDNGVNYIDTQYSNEINYECYLGDFFNRNPKYREKALISTKISSELINNKKDINNYFEKQLKNLKLDLVDFYLLDVTYEEDWKKLVKYGVLEFLDKIKKEGKVKYIGLSFQGELELFFEVIDAYDWDVTQIPFNFMGINKQTGFEGIRYAQSKNIGTIITKPLRSGYLINNIPSDIQEIWDFADDIKSPVQWCLNFLWDYDEIDIVLSNMSTLDQLKENIEYANNAIPGCMTSNDKDIIKEVRFAYKERRNVRCDNCGHCLPCPEGVNIPKNFEILNDAYMYNIINEESNFSTDIDKLRKQYSLVLKEDEMASNCNACGDCEKFCAQFINISDKLIEIEELFED